MFHAKSLTQGVSLDATASLYLSLLKAVGLICMDDIPAPPIGAVMWKRLRKLVFKLLILLCSIVVVIFLSNYILGLISPFGIDNYKHHSKYREELLQDSKVPKVVFEHKIDSSIEAGRVYRTNNIGGRGGHIEIPKPEGLYRILFVGDSITFGWGVAEEDIYVTRIEQALRELCGPDKIECVNLSVLGYNTVQEVALLNHRGVKVEPDLVCIVFCGNDVVIAGMDHIYCTQMTEKIEAEYSGFERFMIDSVFPVTKKWTSNIHSLLTYLFIVRHYRSYDDNIRDSMGNLIEGFARVKRSFKEFKKLGEKKGFKPVVLDLEGWDRLKESCGKIDLEYISIYEVDLFEDQSYHNSKCDPHPNSGGHAILAERVVSSLKPFLSEAGLLPR